MSKTFTRADIVESIQNQIGLSKKSCAEMVEILIEKMKTTLASGEDVMITGFGKFSVKNKRERFLVKMATAMDFSHLRLRIVIVTLSLP